ncbi:DUF1642 domain-containing protein [Listeria monocytogenes]|uniref:DUF1642 domain-containing protein n=2 Tax=Listeria monocytogenes TaxID=1639 RepID=UPI000E6CC2C0|nr:DUF1642 domain-containing protein [Listeria monocytogenes]EIE4395214.1 DUF1642 domain-containing protein [Listeria monocytogenes]EJM9969692.1 DUF1642 domain-containing protein [Listeria monocytogenes]EJN2261882.1 DUF1642 domain-containing protein [Listeria monocytogenes]EJN6787312.1 DUF1642 domain-containing protein [Listeria monocytogenes]EJN6850212.1 DUF1642 domain-containing protein [Listeria monocytogenes]
MRFREGDRVELILRSKKRVGTVEEVYNDTQKCKVQIDGFPVTVTKLQKYLVKAEGAELVLPQFADDWISHCKQREYDLACLLDYEDSDMSDEMYEWLISSADNQELLARAWLDGYEVEKEPLYYVRLPLSTWNDDAAELEVINMYVLLNKQSDETTFTGLIINKNKKWTTKLTEAEIKGMPEGDIYWQFAVPVEGAEGEA